MTAPRCNAVRGADATRSDQLRHGLSQSEVAAALGISRQAVAEIERKALRKLRDAVAGYPALVEVVSCKGAP